MTKMKMSLTNVQRIKTCPDGFYPTDRGNCACVLSDLPGGSCRCVGVRCSHYHYITWGYILARFH